MMKNDLKSVFIAVFISLFGSIFAQNTINQADEAYVVNYETTFTTPTLLSFLKKQVLDPAQQEVLMQKINRYKIFHKLTYLPKENHSFYELDSIKEEAGVRIPGHTTLSYKDKEGRFYVNESFVGKDYTFTANEKDFKWEIHKDTINIGNQVGYLATTKKIPDLKVWFAPNIPIKVGPVAFYGLPGLVIKYEFPLEQAEFLGIKKVFLDEDFLQKKASIIKKLQEAKSIPLDEVVQKKQAFIQMAQKKMSKAKE